MFSQLLVRVQYIACQVIFLNLGIWCQQRADLSYIMLTVKRVSIKDMKLFFLKLFLNCYTIIYQGSL